MPLKLIFYVFYFHATSIIITSII